MNPTEVVERPAKGSGRSTHGAARRARQRRAMIESSLTVGVFTAIFAVYGVWLGEAFLNIDGRLLDVHQSVPTILLGLAVLITLVCGLFDLSVASNATLSMYLTVGLTIRQELPFPVVIALVLGFGVMAGIVNGLIVEILQVNTFIATLGTGSLMAGAAAVYSDGSVLTPAVGEPQLPGWFTEVGSFGFKPPIALLWVLVGLVIIAVYLGVTQLRPSGVSTRNWRVLSVVIAAIPVLLIMFPLSGWDWLLGMSWSVMVLLTLAAGVWILLERTVFGRNLRATGSNKEAARLAGVKVSKEIVKAFALGGLIASTAGVMLAASQGSASPDAAAGFLLPAFAAAFLSTVVFSTGRFSVHGTVLGGAFVVWTALGLVIGGLPPTWTNIVNGAVLLVAVALSTVARKLRR